MRKLITAAFLASIFPAMAMANSLVDHPMQYAEESSKEFAMGDVNDDSGWNGCTFAATSTEANPSITCNGSRVILVHGGEPVSTSFVCEFEFSAKNEKGPYEILKEDCQ